MKSGVYLNTFSDKANLIVIENNSLEDGNVVTIFDYNFKLDLKNKNTIVVTFDNLIYLGKL